MLFPINQFPNLILSCTNLSKLDNTRQLAGSRLLNNDSHTFTYDNSSILELMKTYLDDTNFTGLSVHIELLISCVNMTRATIFRVQSISMRMG